LSPISRDEGHEWLTKSIRKENDYQVYLTQNYPSKLYKV